MAIAKIQGNVEHLMRKIGLLGGSFDPIHFGHLNLAMALLEQDQLDQVLFCPASLSPFKETAPPSASKQQRREMVKLAIAPVQQFAIFDWELEREGVSYTIDTVKKILEEGGGKQLHLILADDALARLPEWKEYQQLLQLAPPLIGSRLISPPSLSGLPSALVQTIEKGMRKVPIMEISSTEIRQRLRQKKFCGHLLPAQVLDYIQKNRLYS